MARTPKGRTFDWALKQLKAGKVVARTGWNGANQALFLIPGSQFVVERGRPMAKHFKTGTPITYQPHIDLLTAQGTVVPWFPSLGDVMGEDWIVTTPVLTQAPKTNARTATQPKAKSPRTIGVRATTKLVQGAIAKQLAKDTATGKPPKTARATMKTRGKPPATRQRTPKPIKVTPQTVVQAALDAAPSRAPLNGGA